MIHPHHTCVSGGGDDYTIVHILARSFKNDRDRTWVVRG
jgi:hypothetical protein